MSSSDVLHLRHRASLLASEAQKLPPDIAIETLKFVLSLLQRAAANAFSPHHHAYVSKDVFEIQNQIYSLKLALDEALELDISEDLMIDIAEAGANAVYWGRKYVEMARVDEKNRLNSGDCTIDKQWLRDVKANTLQSVREIIQRLARSECLFCASSAGDEEQATRSRICRVTQVLLRLESALKPIALGRADCLFAVVDVYHRCSLFAVRSDCIALASWSVSNAQTFLRKSAECVRDIRADTDRSLYEAKLDTITRSVERQKRIVKSVQALITGNEILTKCEEYEERQQHDILFDVLDKFKEAEMMARGVDVALEAEATSRIAILFGDSLHLSHPSKRYCDRALQLARSVNVLTQSQTALIKEVKSLRKCLREGQSGLDSRKAQRCMEEMKDVLSILEHKGEELSLQAYIEYIYEHFSPKSGTKPANLSSARKLFRDAVLAYHPDKNRKERYGTKWFLLCERITCHLNCKFEELYPNHADLQS